MREPLVLSIQRDSPIPPSVTGPALGSVPAARLSQESAERGQSKVSDSDAALVARTLDGDLGAFACLMARYRDSYGHYAFHMLGNREDAQEVMQDSFLRAYAALRRCRQPDRFGAWLFRIVVNRCRTVRRRLHRDWRFAADLPGDVPTAGDAATSLEWREEIARALARLRPRYREAFLLRYVRGLEYREMAHLTGANEPTLRMRVKRAADRLREILQDVNDG